MMRCCWPGVVQQHKTVASGDRALCQWVRQSTTGGQQERLDHQEGHRLHAGQGKLTLTLKPSLPQIHSPYSRFQSPRSPVIVFLAASDLTYTAVHCRWSCVFGGCKPPLEQSATRRHISSNTHCFSEPLQDLPFFQIISLITVVCT